MNGRFAGGRQKLLKVSNVVEVGPQKIESVVWTDQKGDTVKSLSRASARKPFAPRRPTPSSNPPANNMICSWPRPCGSSSPFPMHIKQNASFIARILRASQIEGLFSDGLVQRVKRIDDQTEELTVIAIRPDAGRLDRPQTAADRGRPRPQQFHSKRRSRHCRMAARVPATKPILGSSPAARIVRR